MPESARTLDIGAEVDELVEQDAGRCQHTLDIVGRLGDRTGRGVDRQLAFRRRLVVVADAGEAFSAPARALA